MPIFEYECRECTSRFELLVRNGESPSCPACSSPELDKLLSATAVHGGKALPISSACPPSDAPPCGPGCCRLG